MLKHLKIIILAILVQISAGVYAASGIKASLDSTDILMGRTAILTLSLDQDASAPGKFPLFEKVGEKGIVTLLGDTVELRVLDAKADTLENAGGKLRIDYRIPVQIFDSGKYVLPAFLYVTGADTLRSNSVTISVNPVKVTADAEISPDSGVLPAPATAWQKFTDKIPDFIYYYWWLLLLLVAAIVAGVMIFRKYRKTGVLIKPKPAPSPYQVAIAALQSLKSRKLWENGQEREYFTELTDILRNYLFGRFGINAMEMTSAQILDTLSSQKDISSQKDYVRRILNVADFVKFAKMRPLPDDNIEAFTNALKFVEETRPVVADTKTDTTKKKGV